LELGRKFIFFSEKSAPTLVTGGIILISKGQGQGPWKENVKIVFCSYLREKISLRQTKTKLGLLSTTNYRRIHFTSGIDSLL